MLKDSLKMTQRWSLSKVLSLKVVFHLYVATGGICHVGTGLVLSNLAHMLPIMRARVNPIDFQCLGRR